MASNLLVLFINLLVLELFIVKQYIRGLATKNWENGSLNWQLRARLKGETKDRTLQTYGVVLAKARSSNDLTLLSKYRVCYAPSRLYFTVFNMSFLLD